jgi:hypothetical protein
VEAVLNATSEQAGLSVHRYGTCSIRIDCCPSAKATGCEQIVNGRMEAAGWKSF